MDKLLATYWRFGDGVVTEISRDDYRAAIATPGSRWARFRRIGGSVMFVLSDVRDSFSSVMAAAMREAGDDHIVSSEGA